MPNGRNVREANRNKYLCSESILGANFFGPNSKQVLLEGAVFINTMDEPVLTDKGTECCGLEGTAGGKKTISRFFETGNIPKTSTNKIKSK